MKEVLLYTQMPGELKRQLEAVCVLLGIKKKRLVEEALREKLSEVAAQNDIGEQLRDMRG